MRLPRGNTRQPWVLIRSAENRQVDLIGEGFDAAIRGGMELAPGVVAQRLAPLHVIAVAAPAYIAGRRLPQTPRELDGLDGVSMRSAVTGRLRIWTMRDREGAEATLEHKAWVVAPEAICRASFVSDINASTA